MKRSAIFHTLAGAFLAQALAVSAAVPRLIHFQGLLVDQGTGQPINGQRTLTFRIYGQDTGGSALWTEQHGEPNNPAAIVTVTDGFYNVLLGSLTPLDLAFDADYWLSVQVDTAAEMAPRHRLAASPYALNAERLGGLDSLAFLSSGGGTITGDLAITGSLDVGGSQPGYGLTVSRSLCCGLVFFKRAGFNTTSTDALVLSHQPQTDNTSDRIGLSLGFLRAAGDDGSGAGLVFAGKEGDYTTASASDGYLALSTTRDATSNEHLRITSDGNVGIGTTDPVAQLHVIGEVRTTDANGQGRVWGEGRPNAIRYGLSGVEAGLCSNGSISFGLSLGRLDWADAAAACPAGTWVCTQAERGSGICDTPRPDSSTDYNQCNFTPVNWPANQHVGWVADNNPDTGNIGNGLAVSEDGSFGVGAVCELRPVWCCSQ